MKIFSQVAPTVRTVFFVFVSIAGGAILTGCASLTKGGTDSVHVATTNCGESISCKARNKKGNWDFSAPGSVAFTKSDTPLTITCQDGPETLTTQMVPTSGFWNMGNIFFVPVGIGLLGFLVDSGTDAHWDMVDSISLHRAYCRDKKTN